MNGATAIAKGAIKYPAGKVSDFGYGPRQNVLVLLATGEEARVWFPAGQEPHASLVRNEPVTLLVGTNKKGEPKYDLVFEADQQPKPATAIAKSQPAQKTTAAVQLDEGAVLAGLTDRFATCLDLALAKFPKLELPQHLAIARETFNAACQVLPAEAIAKPQPKLAPAPGNVGQTCRLLLSSWHHQVGGSEEPAAWLRSHFGVQRVMDVPAERHPEMLTALRAEMARRKLPTELPVAG